MKSFAASLLLAGAYAAQIRIEYGQSATYDISQSNLINWDMRLVTSQSSSDAGY
jgi:hypothetical protein